MKYYQTEITVPAAVIDDLNHVNNVAYLQWVQDIARQHWESTTNEALRENLVWVVVNHFIEYKAPAFEKEVLILKTWVEKYSGVTSERHTEIIRKTNQKLLVKAKTIWCMIDKSSGKPMRITKDMIASFP